MKLENLTEGEKRQLFTEKIKSYIENSPFSMAEVGRKIGIQNRDTFHKQVELTNRMPDTVIYDFCKLFELSENDRAELLVLAGYAVPPEIKNTNQDSSMPHLDWESLREEYLNSVRKQYRTVPLRGLIQQPIDGPLELSLVNVFIKLSLRIGVEPLKEFDIYEEEESQISQQYDTPRDQQTAEWPDKNQIYIERKTTKLEKDDTEDERDAQCAMNIWDALDQKHIVIVGKAGAGKTSTIQYIALILANEPAKEKVDPRFKDRVPIVVRLAKFAEEVESTPRLRLADHVCAQYKPEFKTFLERELIDGRCVVLLDGLDEVQNTAALVEHIHIFTAAYGDNYIVVTSREHTFRQSSISMNFAAFSLEVMNREQIDLFIEHYYDKWFDSLANESNSKRSKIKALTEDLEKRPRIAELAKNPLMLKLIVMMSWRGAELPDRPIEVYQAATNTLLRHWPVLQQRIGIKRFDLQTIRQILMPIAYETLKGNGIIGEDKLLTMLTDGIIYLNAWDKGRAKEEAIHWKELIIEQSGLIIDMGLDNYDKYVFEFFHRSLAEYLAAAYLAEQWEEGKRDFVFDHLHDPQWRDVMVLFVAYIGLGGMARAKNILNSIRNKQSDWEPVVWRDHLFAGQCLGENIAIEGKVRNAILEKLITLLTAPHSTPSLRSEVVKVLATLRGTQSEQPTINYLLNIVDKPTPSYIKRLIAEALLNLGEQERSFKILTKLREVGIEQGDNSNVTEALKLLLQGWKKETISWLVKYAQKYKGRGITIQIDRDLTHTRVTATDEGFGQIPLHEYFSQDEQHTFMAQLYHIFTTPEEREKAQWVLYQLNGASVDEIKSLATQSTFERVHRLAAEWLTEHGEHNVGIDILSELATKDDGNLCAIEALNKLEEQKLAIRGAQTTLTKTLNDFRERRAAVLLGELGKTAEAEAVLIELLLSQNENAPQAYLIAKELVKLAKTTGCPVGLTACKAITMSTHHIYRYDATVILSDEDEIDDAYCALIDIAQRYGVWNRINAVIKLNDSKYKMILKKEQEDISNLARHVVNGVSDKYYAVTRFITSGVIPKNLEAAEKEMGYKSHYTDDEWDQRAQEIWETVYSFAEKWLDKFPEQLQTNSYILAARAYILIRQEQQDKATTLLKQVVEHPDTPAQLLFRVSKQLFTLNARDEGLKSLSRIPIQSADPTAAWLKSATILKQFEEKKLAVEAALQAKKKTTEFSTRLSVAHLLVLLGSPDEGKELLFRNVGTEVPTHMNWLNFINKGDWGELLVDLADHMISSERHPVYVHVKKAEALRQLERHDEANEVLNKILENKVNENYALAWRVKGHVLENMNQREQAIDALDRAIQLDPMFTWAWFFKAETLNKMGIYEKAHECITHALILNEQYAGAWVIKGQILEHMGDREGALVALNRALQIAPKYEWALCFKAEILRRTGQYEEAIETVKKVFKLNDKSIYAWKVKSEILDNIGQYQDAITQLDKALKNENHQIRICAIYALQEIGRSDTIDIVLERLEEDQESEVRVAAAYTLGTLGNRRATKSLIHVLKDKDTDATIREAAATALGWLEDPIAFDALFKALEDKESSVRTEASEAIGNFADEDILKKLTLMIREGEKDVVKGAAFGLALTKDERALDILQEAATEQSEHAATLHRFSGILLRYLGRFRESITALKKAIKKDPNQDIIYFSHALTYQSQGNYKHALKSINKAIEFQPYRGFNWGTLGDIYFEMEQDDKALSAWGRAKRLTNGEPSVLASLGIGLWVNGDRQQALRLWKRALEREKRVGEDEKWLQQNWAWGPRMIRVAHEMTKAAINQKE